MTRCSAMLVLALVYSHSTPGQRLKFERHEIGTLGSQRVAGCALAGRKLATWGEYARWWNIPGGESSPFGQRGPFAEGGAILDVNGDGQPDLVVNETTPPRALVWLEAPRGLRHVIDTNVDTADVMPAELFGRRGILLVHRRAQVRFYEIPMDPAGRWPVTELYSFYTPSDQGGLAVADIDGDGRPDILCGNYWIRSPESFDLPWRLFAIELWNEEPHSAMLRLALVSPRELIAMQREMPAARFARFERPADPRQLWIEHPIAGALTLDQPHALDVADFDGDGRPDVIIGEAGGAGRLILLRNLGAGRFDPQIIASGVAAEQIRAVPAEGGALPDILTIGKGIISWWHNQTH